MTTSSTDQTVSLLGRILSGFSRGGCLPWGQSGELILMETEVIRTMSGDGKILSAVAAKVPHSEIASRLLSLPAARLEALAKAVERQTRSARLTIPEVVQSVREAGLSLHGARAKLNGKVFIVADGDAGTLEPLDAGREIVAHVDSHAGIIINSPTLHIPGEPIFQIETIMCAIPIDDAGEHKGRLYFFGPAGDVTGQMIEPDLDLDAPVARLVKPDSTFAM